MLDFRSVLVRFTQFLIRRVFNGRNTVAEILVAEFIGRYMEKITTRCRNGLKAEMVQIGADWQILVQILVQKRCSFLLSGATEKRKCY